MFPAGHVESDTGGQLYFGTVVHYNLVLQTQFQELIWSRDRIHWHRFDEGRIPWLSNGPVGTFDAGFANNLAEYYSFTNSEGEEEWWFPYMGNPARYMLAAARDTVRKRRVKLDDLGLEFFKSTFPPLQQGSLLHQLGRFLQRVAVLGLDSGPGALQGRATRPR